MAKKTQDLKNVAVLPIKLKFQYSQDIEKHWFHGSSAKTHVLNSLTLMLPAGEKFFVRSVKNVLDQVQDLSIRESAKGFITQEMHHYNAHEAYFQNMRDQGYEIDFWTGLFQTVLLDWMEPKLGKELNLAMTAGFEHFTSLIAEIGLESNVLEGVHPEMKELFEWHAAEEIQHKGVCFDVLNEVNDSFGIRVAAMFLGTGLLGSVLVLVPTHLVFQDKKLFDLETWKDFAEFYFTKEAFLPKAFSKFLEYFDPSFHPWNVDNMHLADRVFQDYNPEKPVRKSA